MRLSLLKPRPFVIAKAPIATIEPEMKLKEMPARSSFMNCTSLTPMRSRKVGSSLCASASMLEIEKASARLLTRRARMKPVTTATITMPNCRAMLSYVSDPHQLVAISLMVSASGVGSTSP